MQAGKGRGGPLHEASIKSQSPDQPNFGDHPENRSITPSLAGLSDCFPVSGWPRGVCGGGKMVCATLVPLIRAVLQDTLTCLLTYPTAE